MYKDTYLGQIIDMSDNTETYIVSMTEFGRMNDVLK